VCTHDGQTIVVIGHRATRCGLAQRCGTGELDEIVLARGDWRDVPIVLYACDATDAEQRLEAAV
jgi:hypothetical protein